MNSSAFRTVEANSFMWDSRPDEIRRELFASET
jgi:hypothetical protein